MKQDDQKSMTASPLWNKICLPYVSLKQKVSLSLHFSQSFNKRTAKFEIAIKKIFSIMTLYFPFFLVFRICIPDWQTQVAWMKCILWSGLPDPGFSPWCYRVTRLTFWTFCMRPTLSFQIQVFNFPSVMYVLGSSSIWTVEFQIFIVSFGQAIEV